MLHRIAQTVTNSSSIRRLNWGQRSLGFGSAGTSFASLMSCCSTPLKMVYRLECPNERQPNCHSTLLRQRVELWPPPMIVRALGLFRQRAGAIHRTSGEFKLAARGFLLLTAPISSVPTDASHTASAAMLGQLSRRTGSSILLRLLTETGQDGLPLAIIIVEQLSALCAGHKQAHTNKVLLLALASLANAAIFVKKSVVSASLHLSARISSVCDQRCPASPIFPSSKVDNASNSSLETRKTQGPSSDPCRSSAILRTAALVSVPTKMFSKVQNFTGSNALA